ncbi:histidine kinase dimerization/phospho-acceptor domain-containing protein [Pedobacter sp. MR2016-24]|uniref:histidine kinase dimerization/phospho-acceptor domain-containing protein n=1 Tax=Pedobacter sp. MR2016-24 TaxID=2994466 RepID=UPI0022484E42|nr:histidine kinase dimerization/phospho-acceptor domain-containing protein [Pedobacter sp. MR2016-24]MCX2484791.1 PAS domain-containing protein [Pedobacter sp. MR2016-24]
MSSKRRDDKLIKKVTNTDFLYEEASCGFITFHPDGTILKLNKTLSNWIGKSADEIYGLKFESLLSRSATLYFQMVIYPLLNYQDAVNDVKIGFNAGYGNFEALFNAIAYKNKEGKVVAVNAVVLNNREGQKHQTALLSSKQKADEEKYKFEFLSDAIPGFVWTALPDGQINFINKRIRRYFNIGDASSYSIFSGVAEEDRETALRAWARSMETGRNFDKEVRLQTEGKDPEWFLLRAEPYYNENEQIKLWIGSAISIHKKKMLQLANYSSLAESLTHAQQTLDQNKKMFLNIAMDQSHMIRKPLANILGLIELLNDNPTPEENPVLLKLLLQSSEELDTLIKKVVNYTQN